MKIKLDTWPATGWLRGFYHWCPGCDDEHLVLTETEWTWDGDVKAPTVTPALLSIGPPRCHYELRAGRIEYRADCTHALAGKTIDLPDLPEDP